MHKKTHFTRKNLIFLALVFFFLLMQTFVMVCLDGNSGFIKKNNPISQFAQVFGFTLINLGVVDFVCFFLAVFYTFVFIVAILYQVRLAKFYGDKVISSKKVVQYGITGLACFFLSFGLSIILQMPYGVDKFNRQFKILWQSFILGGMIYFVLAAVVIATFTLIINFRNIDKPFRFFGKKATIEQEIDEDLESLEAIKQAQEADLASSLEIPAAAAGGLLGGAGVSGAGGAATVAGGYAEDEPLKDKERIFPGLCLIDAVNEFEPDEIPDTEITLEDFCASFREYLANQKLYFSYETIREFIAGLATTRLIILEGLSGTGKSSLPRYLSNFLSSDAFFVPVQATWRDRTSLLGFYNDFSKSFTETDFLKRLYQASYEKNKINIMVLDELNLSRIEYYFADFLSVLEYPTADWKINLMQLPYHFDAPRHVIDGKIQIPENTFFVGTANKDDSTYTITDKVYDRAITIEFDDRNESFEPSQEVLPIVLSYEGLKTLFENAKNNQENCLTVEERNRFKQLSRFTYETFEVTFGNRIMNQIELFVPVYVACGGTKEEALDFMFSRKILYKLEGRFEDYIKQGLLELRDLIEKLYPQSFNKSLQIINRLLKRL